MPVSTQRVGLSEQAYDRLRVELALLLMERATGSFRVRNEPEQRERRIRRLQELIRYAAGHEPPDDGVAEPGTPRRRHPCSSLTAGLGAVRARQGQRREYRIPRGEMMTVTLPVHSHRPDSRVVWRAHDVRRARHRRRTGLTPSERAHSAGARFIVIRQV